ncbi:killer toxin Kp4/SMK [Mycena maculata]|uniref:Killer toxin Kp4/SMK n=1 Tax=Mycena maculata TaxID=230809 RepID=A0AAD7JGX8_9AGAR|nr:killer toxin Kp4/SMK [Mycena maculata]
MRFVVAVFLVIPEIVHPLTSAKAVETNVAAFGINCQGSLKCDGQPRDTAACLRDYIVNGINVDGSYDNGKHIACQNNICAFLQSEKGPLDGGTIQSVAPAIVDHGCTACGSVPTSPGNNVEDGQLTFNYVDIPACENSLCN